MAIVNDIQGGPFWSTSPIIWFQTYRPFNGYSRFRLDKIFSHSQQVRRRPRSGLDMLTH